MQTPWGASQTVEKIARGFNAVTTASHGGYMIGIGFAQKHLSPEAQAEGMEFKSYLAYEEDCQWAIVAHELPELWPHLFPEGSNPAQAIKESLERWNPEYLKYGSNRGEDRH